MELAYSNQNQIKYSQPLNLNKQNPGNILQNANLGFIVHDNSAEGEFYGFTNGNVRPCGYNMSRDRSWYFGTGKSSRKGRGKISIENLSI